MSLVRANAKLVPSLYGRRAIARRRLALRRSVLHQLGNFGGSSSEVAVDQTIGHDGICECARKLEAIEAAHHIVERILGEFDEAHGLRDRRDLDRRTGLVGWKDHEFWDGGFVHPFAMLFGWAEMRNGSFVGTRNRGPDLRARNLLANNVYRLILEWNRPWIGMNRQTYIAQQGEFIGKKPPAVVNQVGAQCAFTGAGQPWHNQRAVLIGDDGGMEHQKLMRTHRNEPIGRPFNLRHHLVGGEGHEDRAIVKANCPGREPTAAQGRIATDFNVGVGEMGVVDERIVGVVAMEAFRKETVVATQAQETNLGIEAAEGAYRAGRGSQADIFVARASRVALDDRLSELDRRILNARAILARWVGNAADTPLAGEPLIDSVPIHGHTLESDLEQHPTIMLLKRQVELAESDVQLAKANKQSDWSVELAYGARGPAYSDLFSVGVSIPLQWDQKNRQDRELAAKLAMADQAKALEEDALRAHVAEVRMMLNEWENGRERLGRYERELIPLAKDRTQAVLAAYRGGKADLTAVLGARRNEIEVRMQAVQLEMDTARVWAQLKFLIPDGGSISHSDIDATTQLIAPASKDSK